MVPSLEKLTQSPPGVCSAASGQEQSLGERKPQRITLSSRFRWGVDHLWMVASIEKLETLKIPIAHFFHKYGRPSRHEPEFPQAHLQMGLRWRCCPLDRGRCPGLRVPTACHTQLWSAWSRGNLSLRHQGQLPSSPCKTYPVCTQHRAVY